MRQVTSARSTVAPIHAFAGSTAPVRSRNGAISSGRFVRTWYECRGVARMMSSAASLHASAAPSCQKSDIELTKMREGSRMASGLRIVESLARLRRPLHTGRPFTMRVVPAY